MASVCCLRRLLQSTRRSTNGQAATRSDQHVHPPTKPRFDQDQLLQTWRQPEHERGTFLYLAYGSNLCHETFQGRRGIKPLSWLGVVVPELRMTFDLPGVPYSEPCFANSALRKPAHPDNAPPASEKTLVTHHPSGTDYHKDRWRKGMVGVVYEVTPSDYAHIIATEGGGSSYQDILIACHALSSADATVPSHPTSAPFKAHTLFAPAVPPDQPQRGGRFQRPDPAYAQPSARYLKLITDGADEHALPQEYKDYLRGIRPYRITTQRQRLGQFIFGMVWLPFVMLVFSLQRQYQDERGRSPKWLRTLMGALFTAVWFSYDDFFKGLFGDGERTQPASEDEDEDEFGQTRPKWWAQRACRDNDVEYGGEKAATR